tara:strand:+ start:510 stop:2144 length:1635 start_codon:yes stop_codon:yes gene_type:complete
MLVGKKIKKNKKKTSLFYKYYFFSTIIIFFSLSIIFFNSGFWNYYKLKLIPRLEAYGILNYSKLPNVIFLKIKGHFTKVEKIFIEISPTELNKIEAERQKVIKETNDKKIANNSTFEFNNYKSKIIYNNKSYNANIRLKGDRIVHWNEKNKSSYRINIRKNETIMGLKKFSLQKPRVRNYIHEWIFHELNSENGLIKLKYDFINLYINNKDMGIYVVEEFFTKHILEKNKRKNGPIFSVQESFETKFVNSKFEVYDKRIWLNDANIALTKNILSKLKLFINSKIGASETLDLDMWSSYLATTDLLRTYHGANLKSQKFYYNITTNKFEPVPFDGHFWNPILSHASKEDRDRIMIEVSGDEMDTPGVVSYSTFLANTLINDELFAKKYFSALKKVSSKEFLDNFFNKRKNAINRISSLIYSDYFLNDFIHFYGPGIYYFDKEKIYERAKIIRKKMYSDKNKIFAYTKNDKIIIENNNIFNPFTIVNKVFCKKNYDQINMDVNFILKKNTIIPKADGMNSIKCYELNLYNELTNQNIKIKIDNINS